MFEVLTIAVARLYFLVNVKAIHVLANIESKRALAFELYMGVFGREMRRCRIATT